MIRGAARYLGVIFIAVVIVPAVVLSLLAIRSIGREQAYLESQLARTLAAEVDHVSGLVAAEVTGLEGELAAAAGSPAGEDPGADLEAWRARSPLVEIPFLLSPDFEVLWPRADREVRASEAEFIEKQQAFLKNEARVPVYENVAVAHKDDILGSADIGSTERPGTEATIAESGIAAAEEAPEPAAGSDTDAAASAKGAGEPAHIRGGRAGETNHQLTEGLKLEGAGEGADGNAGSGRETRLGDEAKKQVATSLFEQSEPAREKAYRAAEQQGQQISYRNVAPTTGQDYDQGDEDEQAPATARRDDRLAEAPRGTPTDQADDEAVLQAYGATQPEQTAAGRPAERLASGQPTPEPAPRQTAADRIASQPSPSSQSRRQAPAAASKPAPSRAGQEAERLRSVFISQPLKLSEIVSRGASGLVPLAVDGETRLLYWQRLATGKILGCLVDARQVRERIIAILPGIYSPSRVLTVLDDGGLPIVVPQGQEARDWRRPFAAREISEALPRWEVATYLTDPGAISERARTTSILTWLLIFIMFVSIAAGGALVVRSASAELKLAQQKTTFVANVSHELKTPLTSIRMFAEMLRDGRVAGEEKRRQYFDIMTAETERLTRLINNVLDFARTEQGKKRYTMRPCDLVALAAGIVETQRARLETGGFTVGLLMQSDHLTVRADEEAIKQALVNLLSNAEKYSDQTRDIEVGVRREDDKAVISVSDRGVGIRAGEAEKIFAEFYRADDALTSRVKGTGLGLTIARRIARDHGGDITYTAREGGGSIFGIVLPLVEEKV